MKFSLEVTTFDQQLALNIGASLTRHLADEIQEFLIDSARGDTHGVTTCPFLELAHRSKSFATTESSTSIIC
jgi:hypothetical protein